MINDAVLEETDPKSGLTSEEALVRLRRFGPNEIVRTTFESRLAEVREIFLDPGGLMLLGLGILYLVMGDRTDAIVMFVAYIPITGVDVLLQLRAKRALSALKSKLRPSAKVIRDAELREVATRELVRGDVLVFEEGQSLPVDGLVIEAENLSVNEAAITGESLPIEKVTKVPFLAGTSVIRGRGLGVVTQTGKETQFGAIATLLETTESELSPLQKKVANLVKWIFFVAILLAGFLFALDYYRTGKTLESLMVALTFAMSAVPEEFPLVFTLYLSLGAWRLSKHGVLVKSLPSVETLGGVDVICTDKTGTLTEGKFECEGIQTLNSDRDISDLWRYALMACETRPIDAMETAIFEKVRAQFDERPFAQLQSWDLTIDYAFEPAGKHMSHVWRNHEDGRQIIAMKGAVEGVLEHCEMSAMQKSEAHGLANSLAEKGKRILGLAFREGHFTGNRNEDERGLAFAGILSFSDPIRLSVKQAIERCQNAGIEVKMLTGDHPLTAHAVADEIGMQHVHGRLYTGAEIAKMSREERERAFLEAAIFSRVLPEQKHEMVAVLKRSGRVVAMTGDGINDAPALKLADIGISMGVDATDVARSSARMVLLRNNFNGIVEAVFEGRRIFQSLQRSFAYLISFHIPVVTLTFGPSLLGWNVLLMPIHIVLLELVVHPISAFSFENLPGIVDRRETVLLAKKTLFETVLTGLLISASAMALFYSGLLDRGQQFGRACGLLCVLAGNIGLVIVESWPFFTRRTMITVVALGIAMFALTSTQVSIELLHLAKVEMKWMLIAVSLGLASNMPSFISRIAMKKN